MMQVNSASGKLYEKDMEAGAKRRKCQNSHNSLQKCVLFWALEDIQQCCAVSAVPYYITKSII